MKRTYDLAIIGSGFAGSLMAMIARRLGYSVVLIERGRHPRVVIGESSTPLSNLLLEDLADRYDLPRLRPLSKWGTWQKNYPNVACGLKRGFSFYHHRLDSTASCVSDDRRQLLVAASPHDRIADTHWYRADFDEMLVREAQALGVHYIDDTALVTFVEDGDAVTLDGKRGHQAARFCARFVIDASGPRGFLHRALHLNELPLPGYPSTQALFSHFSGVGRTSHGDNTTEEMPPYPPDDAAVHHVFDGGWIWVLHFNNGITSAGVAATDEAATRLHLDDGEPAFNRLLASIPILKQQFQHAQAERPFTHLKRLSFQSETICGKRWALLPSAAGFVDPLLSTGFPLTLLGVSRLAGILELDRRSPRFHTGLQAYAAQTRGELLATSRLIASLYANMGNFSVFSALSLLYFAAASYSETARRLKRPHLASSFLLYDHPTFGPACSALVKRAHQLKDEHERRDLVQDILRAIEPIDVAGLCRPHRNHWYPVDAADLIESAHKVGASRDEVEKMMQSCGFYA